MFARTVRSAIPRNCHIEYVAVTGSVDDGGDRRSRAAALLSERVTARSEYRDQMPDSIPVLFP